MQLLGLAVYGYLSLAFFLGFKVCEEDLIHRFLKKPAAAPAQSGPTIGP